MRGWLLADGRPSAALELLSNGDVVGRARAVQRDDLARAFPQLPQAAGGGFELSAALGRGLRSSPLRLRIVSNSGAVAECRLQELPPLVEAAFPRSLATPQVDFRARAVASAGALAVTEPGALYGVSIDTTSVCNLRCTICALERDYDVKALMPLELFARLDDAFEQLRHISFSLNAEPLLNRRLEAMIELAKRRSSGRITTSLATNAMLLDDARLNGLAAAGLDALEISIDGVSPASYIAVRTGADFEQLEANIARAAALERASKRAPHLSLRWVLSTDNFGELPALLEFAERLGVQHLVVNGLEPYSVEQAEKTHYTALAESELRERFDALEERATRLGMRLDLPRPRAEAFENCDLVEHACVIRVDGVVAPCSPLSYARDFRIDGRWERHPLISFGSVAERPLLEIWNAPDYVEFRRRALAGELHDACRPCLKRAGVICPLKHWNWLATGAPARRL
jgi:MoaA/NifB/PqqE/SkfB family radical SAM enzyme